MKKIILFESVKYEIDDDGFWNAVEVIDASVQKIRIPDEIEGIPVTSIGNLYRNYEYQEIDLREFYIGNNVISLSNEAFLEAYHLQKVVIGNRLRYIGERTFKDCISLHTLVLGSNVEDIGVGAFENCFSLLEIYNLSKIILKKGGEHNGLVAYNARRIESDINKKSWVVDTKEGFKIFMDQSPVLLGVETKSSKVVVPKGIKEIGSGAFSYRDDIYSVSMGDDVVSIMPSAFEYCKNLREVSLSESLTEIDNHTFYYCRSLEKIIIPPLVTRIGERAFYACYKLKSVKLNDNLKILDEDVFFDCYELEDVQIPPNVEEIGGWCFRRTSVKELRIPNCIREVGIEPFSITDIEFTEYNGVGYLGNELNPYLVACVLNEDDYPPFIEFHEDCKIIAPRIFDEKGEQIISITIGKNVEFVGENAFDTLPKLIEIRNYSKIDLAYSFYEDEELNCYFYVTDENEESHLEYDEESDIVYFTLEDEKVAVMTYDKKEELIIPDFITLIISCAFLEKRFRKVVIPKSVRVIYGLAFGNCDNLEQIIIEGESIEAKYGAFSGCDSLKFYDVKPLVIREEASKEYEDYDLSKSKIGYLGSAENPYKLGVIFEAYVKSYDVLAERDAFVVYSDVESAIAPLLPGLYPF